MLVLWLVLMTMVMIVKQEVADSIFAEVGHQNCDKDECEQY